MRKKNPNLCRSTSALTRHPIAFIYQSFADCDRLSVRCKLRYKDTKKGQFTPSGILLGPGSVYPVQVWFTLSSMVPYYSHQAISKKISGKQHRWSLPRLESIPM